jgi:hypothetical protein
MSQQTGVLDKSFIAGADLRTKQYYLVQGGIATPYSVILATGSTNGIIGILQNEPNIGETAVIRMLGTSKMVAKSSVKTGTPITSYSDGIGTPATWVTGQKVIAIALEPASADGDIIEVLITHFSNVI